MRRLTATAEVLDPAVFDRYLDIRRRYGRPAQEFESVGAYLGDMAAEVGELRRLFGGRADYWRTKAFLACTARERVLQRDRARRRPRAVLDLDRSIAALRSAG